MQVLVADDDPVALSLIGRSLRGAGYDVQLAADGIEAATTWLATRPQIVITDWSMPGMDGAALCALIRSTPSERYTYIVLVTARTQVAEVIEGLSAGADDYITKPFNPQELLLRVGVGRRLVALETALSARVTQLQQALAQVHTLEGLLPICAYCKKIRDVGGYWGEIEAYVEQHTDATFTHGLCPTCMRDRVLPELEELRRQQAA